MFLNCTGALLLVVGTISRAIPWELFSEKIKWDGVKHT